ncbi:LOW QUALITY PROTEIN: hypothetical protein MARPO_0010s0077 [Marchantia polymorpha]|uniref:HAT C-terminal dimerisation domain-containing protein n=1 Tax=Marchantia polymorpha TaxID=3197 RepID=A0A2R6XKN5_MARPO|nr:LOW QUALITY PROTEIN: hypothetical protein MARPO_0010s0077 [Marchantia polymorpha]|eukprot:PTQ46678.1 LOW QUALITY PROTEIN: hypothetical protein MARPO_0010s0077 [Marchantia polymorpha]
MKHVKSHHKRQYAGNSNALLGPMDGYLQNSSSLEKKITATSDISDDLILIHFVGLDWTLHKKLLTFTDKTDHSGARLAEIHTLEQFEIVEHIGCLTMDNASNNDTLMSALENSIVDYCIREKILKTWNADDLRIRCLPQIINLSVKAFLKSLGETDDILIDDEIPNRNASNLIRRLRFIVKKLCSSTQQRKQFRQVTILDDSKSMKYALVATHQVLFKYYSFTDDSYFYMMSVILDPRFKKTYLEQKEFESLYPGLIRATFTLLKKLMSEKKIFCDSNEINSVLSQEPQQPTIFLGMFAHCNADNETKDEVDRYLSLQCEDPTVDPLEYWKVHEKQFLFISAVAKDILSIPGSAVAVERIFNCGRDVIGIRRHSLAPATLSALMFEKSVLK